MPGRLFLFVDSIDKSFICNGLDVVILRFSYASDPGRFVFGSFVRAGRAAILLLLQPLSDIVWNRLFCVEIGLKDALCRDRVEGLLTLLAAQLGLSHRPFGLGCGEPLIP